MGIIARPLPLCFAGFAVVKLATERATGAEYAVKIMSLPEMGTSVGDNENTRDDIFKEIDILVGLNHPNVIYLKEYFEEGNKVRTCASARSCHAKPAGRVPTLALQYLLHPGACMHAPPALPIWQHGDCGQQWAVSSIKVQAAKGTGAAGDVMCDET